MEKVFVIADLHFSDENIIRYENRPFKNAKEMDEEIIRRWNEVVGGKDKVFVLGDVGYSNEEQTEKLVARLNGFKILMIGNHDRIIPSNHWYRMGFDGVMEYPIVYNKFFILSHEPPGYVNCNTPYAYIFGHVHSTELYKTVTGNTACVSAERWNYTPVALDELQKLMKKADEMKKKQVCKTICNKDELKNEDSDPFEPIIRLYD